MTDQVAFGCPAPGADRNDRVRDVLDRWTGSSGMQNLVRVSGGECDATWSLKERLRFLDKFSDRWDFRRGAERLDASQASQDSETQSEIHEAAMDLGLTKTRPPQRGTYDYIVVLGGVALSCKLRTDHAADIVKRGVQARSVGLLGAIRRIPKNERQVADSFAPGSETEFDMLNAAAEFAFNLNEGYEDAISQAQSENLWSIVRRYHRRALPDVISLCAPSSDPSRRANTEDTYAFFAATVGLKPSESVLVCTSQIYYPFHLFGAIRMLALPYDVNVEVVGFPLNWASGSSALRGTNNLLQEVRSGIQAAVRLDDYLREHSQDVQP